MIAYDQDENQNQQTQATSTAKCRSTASRINYLSEKEALSIYQSQYFSETPDVT